MAYKAIISAIGIGQISGNSFAYFANIIDLSTNTFVDVYIGTVDINDLPTFSPTEIITSMQSSLLSYASGAGYSMVAADIIWTTPDPYTNAESNLIKAAVLQKVYNNTPSRSIVTGTGATGFQISATRESRVQYSPTMVTTASISGNASDIIVLEICATNSATAANWQEIGRLTNAQALSLAITLQSVQTTSGCLTGNIPLGWFAKLRAITSGTISNSFTSGQEVLS